MERMIRLGLIATIAALGSPAQANEAFCAEIGEVVAAARETPPFSSFPPPHAFRGRRMLGFPVCGADSYRGYARLECGGYPVEGRAWSGYEELVSLIEQCLPQAVRAEEVIGPRERGSGGDDAARRRIPRYEFHEAHLDLGALRFTITFELHPRFSRIDLAAYNRSSESQPAVPD